MPSFFEFHPQAVSYAIYEGKVGCDSAEIVDGPVIEPLLPEAGDVFDFYPMRFCGQFQSIVQHCPINRWYVCIFIVGFESIKQVILLLLATAVLLQQFTKPRFVMDDSVETPVICRNCHSDLLPLNSAEGAFLPHHLKVEIIVPFHNFSMNAVNLEDVVGIVYPLIFGYFTPS